MNEYGWDYNDMLTYLQFILLAAVIIPAFVTDVYSMRIPNVITAGGALSGLIYHSIADGWSGFIFSIAGLATGLFSLLVLYWIGAIGAGDVKLFAAIGSLSGSVFVLYCLMYSLLYAGVIAIVVFIIRKNSHHLRKVIDALVHFMWFKDVQRLVDMQKRAMLRFPFMYAVLPAAGTVWSYFIL